MLYPLSYEGGTQGAYRAAMFPLAAQRKHCINECNTESQDEFDRVVGRAKEEVGDATGNARLRNEGRTDQMRARVRKTGERVKDALRGRKY